MSELSRNQEDTTGVFPAPYSPQVSSSMLSPGELTVPQRQPRHKVALKLGHSPLDWAILNKNVPPGKLRGLPIDAPPPQYVKITIEELKSHKTRHDCWTCINGKVYNITPYIDFHPGGPDEILKCAGKDGTSLFNKYHRWVNADRMLENCTVGVLSKR
ncbi:uncharacterized protein PRCAT00003996001 [Priceomyces carsonii]|uniref:uncharacterized protein n=1 Tax=Priceomyces carsonii TaxID=28549 RepID=UPI002ED981F7|nr:unnamed protein product [Priceomyces carsonii]